LTDLVLGLLVLVYHLIQLLNLFNEGARVPDELHLGDQLLLLLARGRGHLELPLQLPDSLLQHVELVVGLVDLLLSLSFLALSLRDDLVELLDLIIDALALFLRLAHLLKQGFEL